MFVRSGCLHEKIMTQLPITCSKLTIEILEKGGKSVSIKIPERRH